MSYTYFDLFKICNGLVNVPSVILETIKSKLNVEACESAYLCHKCSLWFGLRLTDQPWLTEYVN
jgi:hypothetical protein